MPTANSSTLTTNLTSTTPPSSIASPVGVATRPLSPRPLPPDAQQPTAIHLHNARSTPPTDTCMLSWRTACVSIRQHLTGSCHQKSIIAARAALLYLSTVFYPASHFGGCPKRRQLTRCPQPAVISCLAASTPHVPPLQPPTKKHWQRLRSDDGDVILVYAQARIPMPDDRRCSHAALLQPAGAAAARPLLESRSRLTSIQRSSTTRAKPSNAQPYAAASIREGRAHRRNPAHLASDRVVGYLEVLNSSAGGRPRFSPRLTSARPGAQLAIYVKTSY